MGDIQGQFGADAVMIRSFLHRPLDINDQITGGAFFAGNRIAPEADDIRRAVFAEEFTVILCNPRIIRQQQRDLFPDGIRVGGFELVGQFSGQTAKCRQIDPAFLPVYQRGFHLSGRRRVHGACW